MSKISVVKEKDKYIFTKMKESDEELIFYNMDYFTRIGFPDAEIFIGEIEDVPENKMTGGYYQHTEKLTFPFRHFVHLIQKRSLGESESGETYNSGVTEKQHEPTKNNSMFSSGIYSLFHNTLDFGIKGAMNDMDSSNKNDWSVDRTEKKRSNTYIRVTIPIINEPYLVNWGKYEKAEAKLKQIMREDKVDKSLGKSKIGEMYEIGTRKVRLCESLKEYEFSKVEECELEGSRMYKMSKMN
jgi:hypothetical protein